MHAALTNDRQFTADSRHGDQHGRHDRRPTDADAAGVYSGFQDGTEGFDTVGQRFLRGQQTTDASGVARFTTACWLVSANA